MTGGGNTALGSEAGNNITTASNVIAIGSAAADVSSTTWIGNVYGVTTQNATTAPVMVSADGQLGTVASSERFKKDFDATIAQLRARLEQQSAQIQKVSAQLEASKPAPQVVNNNQ